MLKEIVLKINILTFYNIKNRTDTREKDCIIVSLKIYFTSIFLAYLNLNICFDWNMKSCILNNKFINQNCVSIKIERPTQFCMKNESQILAFFLNLLLGYSTEPDFLPIKKIDTIKYIVGPIYN